MTIQFCRGPAEVTLNIEYSLLTLLAIAQRLEITLICRRKAEQMSVDELQCISELVCTIHIIFSIQMYVIL